MERIIENATCYELESGATVVRQEHCDLWYEKDNKGFTEAGYAYVNKDRLVFVPFQKASAHSMSDKITRYSYDYGQTWE